MNVTLPEKHEKDLKRLVIYVVLIIICIAAIGVAVYQFFADEKLGVILGVTNSTTEEEYEKLKSEFDKIFTNGMNQDAESNDIKKIDDDKNLVYTNYEKTENSLNNYDINVHIPYINIENDTIKKYNEEIANIFKTKAENSLQTKNRNIIYTVEYGVGVTDNILSLIIRSNLKEGNNAQRVIVQTYNYDLLNNKEITLNDMLEIKGIEKDEAQTKINTEIEKVQGQVEELGKLGYNVFSRDNTNGVYKIENTTEFFTYNNNLYLIYAYGNQNLTSEMDLVIL